MEKISKFNKRRAFNKAVGPGKNPKLINVGPTFIPDYRVVGRIFCLPENEKENSFLGILFEWMIECSVETSATFANKDEVAATKESCKRILACYRL